MNLKELLADWNDGDVTLYRIAVSLGMLPWDNTSENFRQHKGQFAGSSAVSDGLYAILKTLIALEAVEYSSEREQFRWNADYRL